MKQYLVDFNIIEWVNATPGARYKSFTTDNKEIRLVEFTENYTGENWCTKGHVLIVVEGSFALDFNGDLQKFTQGDIVAIPAGEEDRHKAVLAGSKKVVLLFINSNPSMN